MNRRSSTGVFRALLGVAALITGCNKTPEPVPTIVSLLMVSGSGQSGFVGSVLLDPLVVRAVDQDGVPVSGMEVNWTVVTGGGVATPAEGVSDPDGLVSTTLRLGSTLGTQTVSATLRGGGQPVTFNATATPAPASQVVIVSGDDQTGVVGTRLPADLTVRVTDAFGNPKQGITVFFTVLIGNGSLSSTTAVSDAAGLARVQWTLGPPASTQRVAAQIPGSLPAIFDATGTPGAPALVLVLAGNNQTAQPGSLLPDSLVAQVTDQYENPVRDVSVTWTVASGNGSVSPTGGRTDAVGRISTAWTIGPTGGSKEARAVVSGLPPAIFQAAGTIIFANVMAGGSHTCGLDQAGVAYCWGFNEAGQLGTGAATSGTVPSNLFPNTVVGGRTFQVPAPGGQVPTLNHLASGGGAHTCAIQASTNLAFCWGLNFNGQIGSGSTSPTLIPSPSLVTGTSVYKAVSAGETHTCAITTGNKLYCWGANDQGQLGVGPSSPNVPVPTQVANALNFVSVAAGRHHTCAVTDAGGLYCWGSNALGQAGLGSAPGADVPTQVPGSSYVQVVAGENHTCALRVDQDAYCWGSNEWGQLGDGDDTFQAKTEPEPVASGPLRTLSAGRFHSCAITSGGVAYCWGLGTSGQLGGELPDANEGRSNLPLPVGGALTFRLISAGGLHTCGVTIGNVAYCWGDNGFGALGDGTQSSAAVPGRVAFQP